MLDGAEGQAVARALAIQRQVGEFFGAERFVEVRSAHLMAEIESMGEPCLAWVEELAALGGRCRIETTCNPRSVDFDQWRELGQDEREYELEVRLSRALARLGVAVLDTCINYQTLYQPAFGQSVAWGDTGTVIWANSVLGARTNFEGGPVALAAGLTVQPSPDDLKQLGASLASYGSLAMFHLVGVTPEARSLEEAFGGAPPTDRLVVEPGDLQRAYQSFEPEKTTADVVVFSAPQLSVWELRDLAARLDGKQVHPNTALLATTSYQNRAAAERLGYAATIRAAGGLLLAGTCFYLLTPRELAERHGWRTIVTDSAKLANIIAGYGYNPVFRPTDVCIEAAVRGQIPW